MYIFLVIFTPKGVLQIRQLRLGETKQLALDPTDSKQRMANLGLVFKALSVLWAGLDCGPNGPGIENTSDKWKTHPRYPQRLRKWGATSKLPSWLEGLILFLGSLRLS